MNLGQIFEQVIESITGRKQEDDPHRDVRPASEDPYGDPADQEYQPAGWNRQDTYDGRPVADASEDPLGDPADQFEGHQVLDASEDPYGDPADQARR